MPITTIFRFGSKVLPTRRLFYTSCPLCGASAKFRLFQSLRELRAWGFPLLRTRPAHFTVCPKCTSVFAVAPDVGWALEHGMRVPVKPQNLKPMIQNTVSESRGRR